MLQGKKLEFSDFHCFAAIAHLCVSEIYYFGNLFIFKHSRHILGVHANIIVFRLLCSSVMVALFNNDSTACRFSVTHMHFEIFHVDFHFLLFHLF